MQHALQREGVGLTLSRPTGWVLLCSRRRAVQCNIAALPFEESALPSFCPRRDGHGMLTRVRVELGPRPESQTDGGRKKLAHGGTADAFNGIAELTLPRSTTVWALHPRTHKAVLC